MPPSQAISMVMWRHWSKTHLPMQHVQGYIGSHWTLPSGNYLLRITPAAAMATINTMRMQNVPCLMAVLMTITMRLYYTACTAWWGRFVAFIKATKRRYRASTCSDSIQSDTSTPVDSYISSWKRAPVDMLPWIKRGVWHIKLMGNKSVKQLDT